MPADNCQRFLQRETIIFMYVASHAQITQNKKSDISLQYLKKEVNDKVNLLHANKHGILPQIDTMIMMGMVKHFQSSQNSMFVMSLQCLKKKLEMKLIFCKQINTEVTYKLISTLWAPKFPQKIKH